MFPYHSRSLNPVRRPAGTSLWQHFVPELLAPFFAVGSIWLRSSNDNQSRTPPELFFVTQRFTGGGQE
jgi:hypothetical protein